MATLTALNVINFLQAQPAITSLLFAGVNGIWLDIAQDGGNQPYLIVSTPDAPNQYFTGGNYVKTTKLILVVYASTLALVDTLVAAIQSVLTVDVGVTSLSFALLLKNGPTPKGELGSAYSCSLTYMVQEDN